MFLEEQLRAESELAARREEAETQDITSIISIIIIIVIIITIL